MADSFVMDEPVVVDSFQADVPPGPAPATTAAADSTPSLSPMVDLSALQGLVALAPSLKAGPGIAPEGSSPLAVSGKTGPLAVLKEAENLVFVPYVDLPEVKPLNPDSKLDQTMAAVANKVSGVAESVLSPGGITLAGVGGGIPTLGKVFGALFGARAVITETPEFIDAVKAGDVPRAASAATGGVIGTLATLPAMASLRAKPAAPAEFAFIWDTGEPSLPKLEMYNLTKDIPGHPKGSTVTRQTLEQAGFKVPPTPPPEPIAPVELPPAKAAEPVTIPDWLKPLDNLRRGVTARFKAAPQVDEVAATYDAISTKARVTANQAANEFALSIDKDPAVNEALIPVLESGGSYEKLAAQVEQVESSKATPELKAQYRYALDHFYELEGKAATARDILSRELEAEQSAGIDVDAVENYVPHAYDQAALFPGKAIVLSESGSGGGSTSFRKQRVFPTYADAVSAGYVPEPFNLIELIRGRVQAGQRLINARAWINNVLPAIEDPISGGPLVTKPVTQPKGTQVAPGGYQLLEIFPGQRAAVSDNFAPLITALTGRSIIPRVLSNAEGFLKHSMLAFDSFHASRMMQKQLAMMGKISYEKGVSLLEFADKDLDAAIRSNDITPEIADWVRENRSITQQGLDTGLNVAGFSDAAYRNVLDVIPKEWGGEIPRTFNRFVFDKLTRGAMLESYVWAWKKYRPEHPEMTDARFARDLSKQINEYYGNLMSQGLFKSRTARDAMRITFLAPQWVESMARNEIRAVTEGAESMVGLRVSPEGVLQPARIGVNAKATATGLAAYVFATQLVNLFTRGHFTWDNPEEGHKMDAWIPWFGKESKGFFISPLSVFAELTHDMFRYRESKEDPVAAAAQIVKNKESPLTRATADIVTGKDYFDRPLITTWEKAKQAAIDATPVPMFAGILSKEKYEGERARRLFGSFGFKVEPAREERTPYYTQPRVGELVDWIAKTARNRPDKQEYIERQLGQIGDADRAKARAAVYRKLGITR